MTQILSFFTGLLFIALTACKTTSTSTVTADHYDAQTDQTTLTLLPYGNIVIPGKWTEVNYSSVSRQHFLQNNDSTTVSAAKNPVDKYPFYQNGQTPGAFVKAFVQWDMDYWKQQGMTVTLLDDQASKGYIVWQVKHDDKKITNVFLSGSKNNSAYLFSGTSLTWSDEKISNFLVQLYADN